ncbi:sigma-70 family RNA polymerase sigma factor [Methylothermus subterraneus]
MLASYLTEISRIRLLSLPEERVLGWQILHCRQACKRLAALVDLNRSTTISSKEIARFVDLWVKLAEPSQNRRVFAEPRAMSFLLELSRRLKAVQNDAEARLIRHNLRLVLHYALRYRRQKDSFLLDLIQEGNLGLVWAARRFDVRVGVRFSTYAGYWVHLFIDRAALRLKHLVHYPVRYARQLRHAENGAEERQWISLDEFPEVARILVDPRWNEEALSETLDCQHWMPELKRALGRLNAREAVVVQQRFGLNGDGEQTLQRIAESLGVSRERVRQIEKQALAKIRQELYKSKLPLVKRSDWRRSDEKPVADERW